MNRTKKVLPKGTKKPGNAPRRAVKSRPREKIEIKQQENVRTTMSLSANAAKIAIVGRPNVGKSSLFNRIAGKRIAIVHDQAGVTRDRMEQTVTQNDKTFTLIDTGGLGGDGVFAKSVDSQVTRAIGDAALVIVVVDGQCGLHPLDEEVAALARVGGAPCVCAVNKCDLPAHDIAAAEFEKLGMKVFPISAVHGRGIRELLENADLKTAADSSEETPPEPEVGGIKIAIVGRPNAGKSSFVNRVLREERLIVSDVPGTTRDTIACSFVYNKTPIEILDTAGMRKIRKIDSAVERFSRFRAEECVEKCDVAVLVIDASEGPTAQDKHIAAMIEKAGKGCVIVVNKWDVAQESDTDVTATKYEPALREAMPFLNHCPVVFVSSKSGFNVRRALDAVCEVARATRTKLPTGPLNRVLERFRGDSKLKVFYATQDAVSPISLRVYVNKTELVTASFTRGLLSEIRSAFYLPGAAIRIYFKARRAAPTSAADSPKNH